MVIYELTNEANEIWLEILKLQHLWHPEGIPKHQFEGLLEELHKRCKIVDKVDDSMPFEWKVAIEEAKRKRDCNSKVTK